MRTSMRIVGWMVLAGWLVGCQTAAQHAADVRTARAEGDRLSVGKVQREIRVGMSSAEVVEVLGSPNMVTTDGKRRENWVYDRISTESVFSTSSGGVNALVLGGALVGAGLVGVGQGARAIKAVPAPEARRRGR